MTGATDVKLRAAWTACTAGVEKERMGKRQYYLILVGLMIVAVNIGVIIILVKLLLLR